MDNNKTNKKEETKEDVTLAKSGNSMPRNKGKNSKGRSSQKGSGKRGKTGHSGNLSSKGRDNNPNWYFTNPDIAIESSKLSFQSFVGESKFNNQYMPGAILALYFNPCPGNTYSLYDESGNYVRRDGINLSAQKIYTLLSIHSGRNSSYAPQDVATMVLYMGEVISMVEYIRRIFGIAMTYNVRNRMLPLKLMKIMGVSDPIEAIGNMADLRMKFNIEVARLNQVPIPANVGYLEKCRDMYQKVYADSPNAMAQLIVPMPKSTWRINETAYEEGTILETDWLNGEYGAWGGTATVAPRTLDEWMLLLHEMIDDLLNSSTFNIIYADLLNMASKLGMQFWRFDALVEGYYVMPEYNRNFLLQVHNMESAGYVYKLADDAITTTITISGNTYTVTTENDVIPDADSNSLIYNPGFYRGRNGVGTYDLTMDHHLIDMDTDAPTDEDRIEVLRYKQTDGVAASEILAGLYVNRSLPDHYLYDYAIYSSADLDESPLVGIWTKEGFASDQASALRGIFKKISKLTQFNYSLPLIVYAPAISSALPNSKLYEVYSQMEYWTQVDDYYIARMNRATYIGLFDFRF